MTSRLFLLFSLGLFPLITASHNMTIEVPDGITSHGDPHMLCHVPASSLDILIFFLSNYIAHAVTVKPYPGESSTGRNLNFLAALFFPTLGLVRGLNAWARHAVFTEGTLERAARSGALCMVVRNDNWEPKDETQMGEIRVVARKRSLEGETTVELPAVYPERIRRAAMWLQRKGEWLPRRLRRWVEDHSGSNISFTTVGAIAVSFVLRDTMRQEFNETPLDSDQCSHLTRGHTVLTTYVPDYSTESSPFWLFPDTVGFYIDSLRTVHGAIQLPLGYSLAYVPRDAKVQKLDTVTLADLKMELCSSYSIPKAVAGFVQAIYSSFTLLSARGAQVHQYGYAAFGLTVLPYTVMTLVNLVGNLLTPDYSTLYLVESDILREANDRYGAVFEGIVGKLVSVDSDNAQRAGPMGWRRVLGREMGRRYGYTVDRWDRGGPLHSGTFEFTRGNSGETGTETVMEHRSGFNVARSHREAVNLEMNPSYSEAIQGVGHANHPASVGTPHSTKILLIDQLLRNSESPARRLPDSHICIQIPACPPFARHHNPPLFRFNFRSRLPSTAVDEISIESGTYFVLAAAVVVNLVIVGILAFLSDRFSTGDSTKAQRGWTMSWFVFGSVGGVLLALLSLSAGDRKITDMAQRAIKLLSAIGPPTVGDRKITDVVQRTLKLFSVERILLLGALCVYSFPAIAGFVVVGQMIREYGTCISF